jgi:hypothetical protein
LCPIGLITAAIEVLGSQPKLDDEIIGEVLRFDFAAFLASEPD